MTVTCEAFGRFLDCFGPLIDEDKNIITKVRARSLPLSWSRGFFSYSVDNAQLVEICEKPWFHGDIGRNDAESRLNSSKENKKGTPTHALQRRNNSAFYSQTGLFLVRLSSNNDSCFTISRINKDNKIVHQRIARDKRGNYLVQVGEELKAFKSLLDLIEKGERDLNLKVPLFFWTICSVVVLYQQ